MICAGRDGTEDVALVSPVDLGLRARDHLEPAVQPGQRVVVVLGELGRDPRPGLGQEHLHPLVVAGEGVLSPFLSQHLELLRRQALSPLLFGLGDHRVHVGAPPVST